MLNTFFYRIEGEDTNYKLRISGLSIKTDFLEQNGMMFSTADNDNDEAFYNCADEFKSGWWMK